MIPIENITETQKEFLSERYGIDVEERARFWRKHFRFRSKLSIVLLPFAVALYWEGTSELMAPYWKPFGIIAWCFVGVLFPAGLGAWIAAWKGTRTSPLEGSRSLIALSKNSWRRLFTRWIGVTPPFLNNFLKIGGSLMVVLAAWLTGRPFLAMAWLLPFIVGNAHFRWEEQKVLYGLKAIESAAKEGSSDNQSKN